MYDYDPIQVRIDAIQGILVDLHYQLKAINQFIIEIRAEVQGSSKGVLPLKKNPPDVPPASKDRIFIGGEGMSGAMASTITP